MSKLKGIKATLEDIGYGTLFECGGEFFFGIDNHEDDVTDGEYTFSINDLRDDLADEEVTIYDVSLQELAEHYINNPPEKK